MWVVDYHAPAARKELLFRFPRSNDTAGRTTGNRSCSEPVSAWPRSRAVSFALLPGCLRLFSKTEVVRGEEARRQIRFANSQAAETFSKAMKDHSTHLGGAHLGVLFVTLYSRQGQLSDSAHFNDCVLRCDTDQDDTITQAVVRMFKGMKD